MMNRSGAICQRSPAGSFPASFRRHRAQRWIGINPDSNDGAKGDRYVINGQKIFISRVLQSDLMLLLARTTPYDDLKDKTKAFPCSSSI